MHSALASVLPQVLRWITELRRPARDGEAVDDMDEAGLEPALTGKPRPSARAEAWARSGEELANVVDVLEDGARAGGIRTRVSTSSPRTLRPSSGIGSRAATPRSVERC